MKSFQFTVCRADEQPPVEVRDETGRVVVTPPVTADTLSAAITHPVVVEWCNQRGYRVYRVVG